MNIFYILSTAALAQSAAGQRDTFEEELLLKPTLNGDLIAHFRFATVAAAAAGDDDDDFDLFPRPLGELVRTFGVEELDLSLSRGIWRQNQWGYSPNPAPPGAKVFAWIAQNEGAVVFA